MALTRVINSGIGVAASIAGDLIVFVNDPTESPRSNPPEKATELAKSHAEQLNAKLNNFMKKTHASKPSKSTGKCQV